MERGKVKNCVDFENFINQCLRFSNPPSETAVNLNEMTLGFGRWA
jgi:hypothetical protein